MKYLQPVHHASVVCPNAVRPDQVGDIETAIQTVQPAYGCGSTFTRRLALDLRPVMQRQVRGLIADRGLFCDRWCKVNLVFRRVDREATT